MRRLFIMRKDLQMSPGKLAAQISHCAEAYWTHMIMQGKTASSDNHCVECNVRVPLDEYRDYILGSFVKTICEAKNKNHLLKAREQALELGLIENTDFGCIYDNCMTELAPEEENGTTLTGIWFKPLTDEIAHTISKKYQLHRS